MSALARPPHIDRREMSRTLLSALGSTRAAGRITLDELIAGLGDRSFGWSMLFFALVNMLPMPVGSNMITALPLIVLIGQMLIGYDRLRLPAFLLRIKVDRRRMRRTVLRIKPLIRPIERIVRPRHTWLFERRAERLIAAFLLAIAMALFVPIPLSGFLSALALFVAAFGLIERDGLVTLIGLAIGASAIALTLVVGGTLVIGAREMARG